MAAAVADYTPKFKSQRSKLKKKEEDIELELEPTLDILEDIGRSKHHAKLVGFALETENLIKNAKEKMKKKHLDMIVANGPEAMGADESEARIILKSGKIENLKKQNKNQTADQILDRLSGLLSR
jgi:phosphopantothenoylcysteine decarboxylase/phosphopantothenate--cysteine ligase